MSNEIIAVTGANGFLGNRIVEQLLASNTKTRAIVRSKESASKLVAKHSKEIESGLLEFAYVPDIATHGPAYDEAFRGATGLIHTASPIFEPGGNSPDKENKFLKPAIFGALNAIESAHKIPSIKKVIFTSSVAAARPRESSGLISNTYFPPTTYEQAANFEQDQETYAASKALAEKAVWDFVKDNNSKFELTALLVGLLIGPSISGKSDNSGSNSIGLLMAKAPEKIVNLPLITAQDAATAHINALRQSTANGRRIFAVEKMFFSHDAVTLAQNHVANFPAGPLVPYPKPGDYLKIDEEQLIHDQKLLNLTTNNVDDAFVQLLRDNV